MLTGYNWLRREASNRFLFYSKAPVCSAKGEEFLDCTISSFGRRHLPHGVTWSSFNFIAKSRIPPSKNISYSSKHDIHFNLQGLNENKHKLWVQNSKYCFVQLLNRKWRDGVIDKYFPKRLLTHGLTHAISVSDVLNCSSIAFHFRSICDANVSL
jgi:hypothetical protein